MTALALVLSVLVPSDDCYARYDDDWCAAHAEALAEAKPQLDPLLTTDEVGGYRVGDSVPVAGRPPAVIGPEDEPFLAAVERHVDAVHRRWLLLTVAGESGFEQYADNPRSTAGGYVQALRMWEPVVGCDRFQPECAALIADHLLDSSIGRDHWQYQP